MLKHNLVRVHLAKDSLDSAVGCTPNNPKGHYFHHRHRRSVCSLWQQGVWFKQKQYFKTISGQIDINYLEERLPLSNSRVGSWLPCFCFTPNFTLASARKQRESGSPWVVTSSVISTLLLTVPRTKASSPGGMRRRRGKEMPRSLPCGLWQL